MILLKNATIFDGENLGTASEDLLLKDGVVARRGTDLSAEGAEVFDLGGSWYAPDSLIFTFISGIPAMNGGRIRKAEPGRPPGAATPRW